ncbi:MAG: hypothetical protein EU517_01450 [Promethearchaeota archaeon]|nr:MAG: hypothetical protein EU517_01450 [Candidatus Lokiarchaeota archaeon]
MMELKTITKVSLLAYGIVSLLNALMNLFLVEIYLNPMTGWNNPLHPRQWGGTLLGIAIFTFLAVFRKKEWEQIKFAYGFLYYLILMNLVVEGLIVIILGPSLSAAAINQAFLDVVLMSVLLILGIYSYTKQKE